MKVTSSVDLAHTMVPLFGVDVQTTRDWNEEYQQVSSFPSDNFFNRLQRDRSIFKVYNDFCDAAKKGGEAIVEQKLIPLNPNEPIKQHVYVFNHIFFSYALNTSLSRGDLSKAENSPSFSQANIDINGLQTLQALNVQGLFHLATCIINYKGNRLICQSIIPGILNNTDLG